MSKLKDTVKTINLYCYISTLFDLLSFSRKYFGRLILNFHGIVNMTGVNICETYFLAQKPDFNRVEALGHGRRT